MWWLFAVALAVPPDSTDIQRALRAAGELEAAGAFEAARGQLQAVIPLVSEPERRELMRRVCATLGRERRSAEALECYRLAGDPLARYYAAILESGSGRVQAARNEMWRLVVEQPQSLGAERALAWLRARRRREAGRSAEADFLLGIASQLTCADGQRLRALSLAEAGRIRLGWDPRGAASILGKAVQAARGTVHLDDALIWSGRAERKNRRYPCALRRFRELVDARSSSWFLGSYDGLFYDDALLEIAGMLEEQGKVEEAIDAYEELVERAPHSRLKDDAAFGAARLRGGAALQSFITTFPDSRHVREARRILGTP